MAKKQRLEEDDGSEMTLGISSATVKKMPTDISRGMEPLPEFMNIPVKQLIPFKNKETHDFSREDEQLHLSMLQSMKEDGVYEALTVRPTTDGKFELLAGETRWRLAIEAGLEKLPCHIINADDSKAHRIFSFTNLLRRTLRPSDRVTGWWHYYTQLKAEHRLKELRDDSYDQELKVAMAQSGGKIDYRQIMRYVKMASLIPEWLNRLDDGTVTVIAGANIASLPADIQEELLPYEVSADESLHLLNVYKGKVEGVELNVELFSKLLKPLKKETEDTEQNPVADGEAASDDATDEQAENPSYTPEEEERARHQLLFKKARPKIIKVAKALLRPTDYERAEDIVAEGLRLYYAEQDRLEHTEENQTEDD